MRKIYLLISLFFISVSIFGQTVTWNFGTAAGNALPSSGTPIANLTISDITQGNNNGTTALLTTTSASTTYAGASGQFNAGAAARIGALNTAASGSAYFEFTLTPAAGSIVNLTALNFGSRSTGTGPQAFAIRTSLDGYATSATTGTLLNNSVWAFFNNTLTIASGSGTPVTIRIYGYNGAGSPGVGTANWRIDDLSIVVSVSGSVTPTISITAGADATEAGANGNFTINFSPATSATTTFDYTLPVAGNAIFTTDYGANLSSSPVAVITPASLSATSGTISVPAGVSSLTVTVVPVDDAIVEGTETVVMTLLNPSSPYTIPLPTATSSINLLDNDLPPNPYISLTNTYSQDFNTLANAGTSSVVPTGWLFNETGTAANTTYTAGTGSSTSGDTYSFGAALNADRAFGTLQSGSLISTIGAQIQNNSGTSISKLKISYTGEQWRLGAESRPDRLAFQYSLNATSLTTGTWTDITNLDFIAPTVLTIGSKDGNAAANRTTITYTLRNLSIPNGSVFLIRWNDVNASGADDGLAIDDFTIEANPIDITPPAIVTLSPANGATNLPINISASITFNEDVIKGTGNIRLRKTLDNSIVQNININSASVAVSGTTVNITLSQLAVNTAYSFEIDNGGFTDLDANPFAGISGNSTWAFTTGINLYVANFQTCTSGLTDGFTQYSVTGAIVWACTTFGRDPAAPAGTAAFPNAVQINGFAGGTNVPNIDWLISPSFNLTGTNFPLLSFWSRTAFNGQPLQLKVSTDYVSGNPTLATWTDINGKFPSQTSNVWTLSENINLSAFKQPNVHFAFVYVSDDDEGARWTLDDVSLGNSPVPPPPSLTVSTNDIQFAYAANNTTVDKTFSFTGNDLTNDITLNATGPFSLSKDGNSFSSSLSYSVAEANNITKTVHVRFAPTQNNQNFSGDITIASGSLNALVNLNGSSIDPATTLEVVNWNIEWFGSAGNGPTNDAQQEQNVKTILQTLNADVYAVSEIVSEARLANVVSQMPGYAYVISNYGSHTNTSVNPVGALAEAQKLAYIYKTSVLSNISTTALVSAGINTAADITNPAYNYFASGRFPYMLSADVTLNCITKNVKFVLVHGKANTSPTLESYTRRKRGSDTLHYTLQQNYPNGNVIILGDYNDDLDFTITAGINPPVTSYSAFINDGANFTPLTLPLSLAGKKSTVAYNDIIDHVIASNDIADYYMPGTANILTDVTSLVSNYAGTTSDHYPVFTRYIFENKIAPTVTNCPVVLPLCTNTDNNFTIPLFTATDDCDDVVYSYVITGATERSGSGNNASGVFNVGTSIITWTATDEWGNDVTCQTTIVVNPSPLVVIPDAYALASGVLANTVYIGYAPASSITLTSVVSGGTPDYYSFSWSNGSTASSTTVSPLVNTTYTVIVTDAAGCTATASKTVDVIDIRAGNKNDKVKVCHNSNTIVVDGNSMIAHLAHGDMLGTCISEQSRMTTQNNTAIENAVGKIALQALPNPSANYFTLIISSQKANEKVSMRVTDVLGRVVEQKQNLNVSQSLKIGDSYRTGVYFVEITQGLEKTTLKLLKL